LATWNTQKGQLTWGLYNKKTLRISKVRIRSKLVCLYVQANMFVQAGKH